MNRLERSYNQEFNDLLKDLGHRMKDVALTVEETVSKLSKNDVVLQEHTYQIQQIFYGLDDQENRSRHNICICGLPEAVEPKDLAAAATAIFNQLLRLPKDSPIKIVRIYRALGPRSQIQHSQEM